MTRTVLLRLKSGQLIANQIWEFCYGIIIIIIIITIIISFVYPWQCVYSTNASGAEQMPETNIRVKNPKWPEANQLAIYKRDWVRIWTREYREQIQLAVREGLELGASELKVGQIVFMRVQTLRACLHGRGWPQIGEVRFRGSPHLSRKPLNMIN